MKPELKQQLLIGTLTLAIVSAGVYGVYRWIRSEKHRTRSPKDKEKSDERLVGQQVHFGEEGYVNVRKEPKIDNTGILDRTHNILKKVRTNPVGTIMKRVSGEDGYSWYHIQLADSEKTGYVREDAVKLV